MIRGVIFDLDGVLVTTDELHFQSWKQVADAAGIYFDRRINERLRGIDRQTSLAIVLERATRPLTAEESAALAAGKNAVYQELIAAMTTDACLPGALDTLLELRRRGLKTAMASSSRNASAIIRQLGIEHLFDALVDGNDITKAKPDPEVFLLAASRLSLGPSECLVVEDALSGIEAARRAGMAVFGIGTAETLPGVRPVAADLAAISVEQMLVV